MTASVALMPGSVSLAVGNSKSFTATGGTPPYTYSLVSGTGSVTPSTGLYTAPGSAGTAIVQVTDSSVPPQTATASLTINPALQVGSNSVIINAAPGMGYTFSGSGGVPAYSYAITAGAGSVGSSTGLYTPPALRGISSVQLSDSIGNTSVATVNNVPIRFNGSVNTMVQAGGAWYFGGNFTAVNPYYVPGFAALDLTTGNVTNSLCNYQSEIAGGNVNAIVVSGGSLYLGGSFTSYLGQPVQNLAKVDATTCALDTTFTQATGFSGPVSALAVSGTSLYVGGAFTTYRGSAANDLAKVDLTSGNLDTSFTQATGFNNTVSALAVSGTSLYVGGFFGTYRGSAANYLAKVDLASGNLDTTFTQATGFNGWVPVLAVSGTSLYVGGYFSTYRGVTANHLAKVDLTSGNLDTTFTQATGVDNSVSALAVSGTSLYVGGFFNTYRGSAANNLAKVDLTSGNLDTTFTQAAGFNNTVDALAVSGTSLYVGGGFTTYRGSAANDLAKVDLASGNLDTTFTQATGFNNIVGELAVSGTSLYVGGGFTTYRGSAANYLAKVDLTSGNLDTTFTQATGFNNIVGELAVSGTSLYVGGGFTTYRGSAATDLAKVDLTSGNLDTTFTQATGFDNFVSALAVSGTSLYVGGQFSTYRGSAANYLAKVDLTSGNLDTTFTQATGFNSGVGVLAVSGTSLYVGGYFTTYRGVAANNLAKVDLTSGNPDTTFTQATGFDFFVDALLVSGTSLYVGGSFMSYRGSTANNLAKVDVTSGNLDTTFTQATGFDNQVSALAVSGTSLYVGGQFSTYRGSVANYLAKVDLASGNLDTTFTQATGFDFFVSALAVSGTTSLYVGGSFGNYQSAIAPDFTSLDLTSGNLND